MHIQPWSVLKSRSLLKRWWLNLREDYVRLPNGAELEEFHVFEYPDWVCAICETEGGELVMVEQYRHGIAEVVMEFPAGVLETGEEPLKAVKRELLEETGFAAEDWHPVGRFATEPARHSNYAHFFYASGARRVTEPRPEVSEDLHLHVVPKTELLTWIESGRFMHGVQLAGLLEAQRRGLLAL